MTHAPHTSPCAHVHRSPDQPYEPYAPLEGYHAPPPKLYNQPYTLPEYIAVLRYRLNWMLEAEYKSSAMRDWLPGGIRRLENKIVQWENYQRIKNGQPVTRT